MGDVYLADTPELRYIFDENGNYMRSEDIVDDNEVIMDKLNADVDKDNAENQRKTEASYEEEVTEDPDNPDIYKDHRYR